MATAAEALVVEIGDLVIKANDATSDVKAHTSAIYDELLEAKQQTVQAFNTKQEVFGLKVAASLASDTTSVISAILTSAEGLAATVTEA